MTGSTTPETQLINPYSTDVIFKTVSRLSRGKPFYTGLLYFVLSFGVTFLLGVITGQFGGQNGLPPMYTTVLDNVNIGIIAPVGAGLLCHLYNTISTSFTSLLKDNTISPKDHDNYKRFLKQIEHLYNSKFAVVAMLTVSVLINSYNYFTKTGSWLGINGGITGLYARVFITINFFIIGYIVYKSIVTVYAMRNLFQFEINVQPLHPDRSGGLMQIGKLAIAVNYFIGLIVLFFTLLLSLDPLTGNNILYTAIIVCFYVISPFLVMSSLSKANRLMATKKRHMLEKLARTFDHYFKLLNKPGSGDIFDITSGDEIIKVNKLYRIVESMPVWPFDIQSIARLVSTVAIPLIPLLLEFLGRSLL